MPAESDDTALLRYGKSRSLLNLHIIRPQIIKVRIDNSQSEKNKLFAYARTLHQGLKRLYGFSDFKDILRRRLGLCQRYVF